EFLGRNDHQIKILGQRIEPEEIETALRTHPAITAAAITTHPAGHDATHQLAAYIVYQADPIPTTELRTWLAQRLPKYMLPRWIETLHTLPLTTQGKLDRRALPAPSGDRPALAHRYVPPLPGPEEALAEIWSRVLGVDRVGRHDDFFDLGGDSIRSIQVLGQARNAGLGFTLQDLNRRPTISELAGVVRHTTDEDPQPAREPFSLLSAEDRERLPEGLEDAYPMAELQVGMVYEMELDAERRPYHNVDGLRLAGPFDEQRFRDAVARVVVRHPILRTSFDLSGFSEPMQLVHPSAEIPLTVVDLRGMDRAEQRVALAGHMRAEQRHPFDPSVAPLLRMAVHIVGDDAFQWTVTEHHAILDGWSMASTLAEINDLYRALLAGEDPAVEPLRSTYGDFIAAERAALHSEDTQRFWLERLADRPDGRVPRWPAGLAAQGIGEVVEGERHERDESQGHGALTTVLSQDLLTRLEEFARRCRVPFKAVVLAAHLRVMSLVTGNSDVLVGLTANSRLEQADGAEVRGLFLNTLPFRLRLPQGSWIDLVQAVSQAEQDLLPHRRYPMSALQRTLGGEPFFEVDFNYNHFHQFGKLADEGALALTDPDAHLPGVARTNFPLGVSVSREPGIAGLRLELDYDARQFTAQQITVLRDYHLRALQTMATDPTASHENAPLLGHAEQHLPALWNDTAVPCDDAPVHELLRRQARRTPDTVAIEDGPTRLTFAQLDADSDRLAHRLADQGVRRGDIVGIRLRPGATALIAVWATWKAGAAFLTLDPDLPPARLQTMVDDAHPTLLISDSPDDDLPSGCPLLDVTAEESPFEPIALPVAGAEDLAYVMYTSGTTGRPKGVMVQHGNLTNYALALLLPRMRSANITTNARVALGTSAYISDFFLEQILPLLDGHTLLVLTTEQRQDPQYLVQRAHHADQAADVVQATTAQIRLLVDAGLLDAPHAPRLLSLGGEACPSDLWDVLRAHPATMSFNTYGPTETTVDATAVDVTDHPTPVIGRPYGNTQIHILDDHQRPTPVGSVGEIHIGGQGVGRGYLNRPATTAATFIPNPWGPPGSRLYRTGDLGRYTTGGLIEFLGRNDHQIKILGQRIEPQEIETALRTHPAITAAAITTHPAGHNATHQLAAYIVYQANPIPTTELRTWLAQRLPKYMLPRWIETLHTLPLTTQGKLDRRALPAPSGDRPALAGEFVAPLPGVEELLADIWSRVLGVRRVGRHDNFFDLGGDSIRSIQVLGQARDAGLDFALQDLFDDPTLAGLAIAADTGTGGTRETVPTTWASEPFSLLSAEDRERLPEGLEDAYPMAELQVGMVYEMELDPERRPYHHVDGLRVAGPFDEQRFRDAVARVVERHPILRTSFDLSGYSRPMQLVHPSGEIPLTVMDLRGADAHERQAALAEYVRREHRNTFDLAVAPLCRMAVHIVDDAFQWTVTEHHAILDGWSLATVLSEITAIYRLLSAGEDPRPAPLRSLYRDFIAAERAALHSEDSQRFWLERLADRPDGRLPRRPAGVPSLGIGEAVPGERHERDESEGHGALTTVLSQDLLTRLEEFARRSGVPFKTVMLAAHLRVMSLVTGGSDVVTGLSSNGRLEEAGAADVCGLFLNTLPFRLRLPEGSWRNLARAVFDAEREMLPHRRYPMPAMQRALGGPLFEAGFVYNHFHQFAKLTEDGALVPADPGADMPGMGRTHFPLLVTVSRETGVEGLRLDLEYDARELTEDQAVALRDYHLRVLEAMVADPEAANHMVSLLGETEHGLLTSWAGGAVEFEVEPVHERVARWGVATPDAVALVCGDETVSYGELNARADRLARRLRALGVGPEVCVGVCAERSAGMVVAALAVLKAGGVYVPLDPAFPAERLRFMVAELNAPLVLTAGDVAGRVPDGTWRIIDVADGEPPEADQETGPAPDRVSPDHGCYVIFTSGSTGRPKGTLVTHRNVTRLFEATAAAGLDAGPADVWTLFHSFAFDFSVWEMWGALGTGGRLVVVPHAVTRDTEAFYELVRHERVTVLSQTPSAFRQFETVDERRREPLALRAVVFGGEALHQPSVRRWAGRHGFRGPVLVNMYGITETTVHVTYLELDERHLRGPASRIGRPLPDLRVHVLDGHGRPCPIGVAGEIHVAGAGVTRGYAGRAALTAERFVPDHLGGRPGGRLYRSGDIARWTAEGDLEYLGRADAQVKIRGHRIETGEVEAALGSHPAVLEAVVILRESVGEQADLVAYVVPGGKDSGDGQAVSADVLRAWLAGRLPDYMAPRWFVLLDALPLTAQGKVDRPALPEPSGARPELAQEYVPPLAGPEEALAGIWRRVLEVDRVGRHDNFFHLGGDSIRSIQVLGQARDMGLGFDLHDLFTHPTPAELAHVAGGGADEVVERDGGEPFSLLGTEDRRRLPDGLVDAYPMAELQVGMVYEMELDPHRRPYHNVESLLIAGSFDAERFQEAVARVVDRHPILRTSFDLTGYSEPVQLVHPAAEVPFVVMDLRGMDRAEQRAVLTDHMRAEHRHPFDLSVAPLLRMAVHIVGDDAFQWTVTLHHAILDGWSLASTVAEINDLYRSLLDGGDPPSSPVRSLYRDFIAAERAASRSESTERFWLEWLAEPPDGRLPRRRGDTTAPRIGDGVAGERHYRDESQRHGSLTTVLPKDLLRRLDRFAKRCGVPFKSVMLAAHLRVLSLVTGSSDVLMGLTANGRPEEADGADVRGLFLNTVPFRLRLPDGTWEDLVRAVFEAEHDLLPHRRYPLSAMRRKLGGAALFDVNFVYNHFHQFGRLAEEGALAPTGPGADLPGVASTNFPLVVAAIREPGNVLSLDLDYDTRELAEDQITVLRDYHLRALEAMAADPEAPYRDVSLLGEAELGLLASWNDTAAEVPSDSVPRLVEARAAASPDAVAVVAGGRSLSYAELNARANRLARYLRDAGVGPDVCVGTCVERSAEMVVALLAILKAGGVYVPLDADLPAERLRLMLGDVGADLVVAAGATTGRVPGGPWRIVDLDAVEPPDDEANLPNVLRPDNGCYVIFTSGSTGRPKGVVTSHRNVTELLYGGGVLALRDDDRVLQIATISFDVATWEIWAPLVAGARLVMAPAVDYTPRDLAAWVDEHQITVLHATASLFALLVEHEPRLFDRLRRFLTGSETVPPGHAARILERCPDLELVNCWGPTETTTFSVCGAYTRATLPAGPLPLGTPLANTQVWVLDDTGRPVPVGTPGELYVAGPCLARGYLNGPAMTAERFLPHPTRPGMRLYRTGDRGMWSVDGQVEFLGRVDHMVKVRGYRVELGEIEAALRAHPLVRECAVVARESGSAHVDLVAYAVPDRTPGPTSDRTADGGSDGGEVSAGALRAWLATRLPRYMVPRWFVLLDALPLTPRAKVDRAALPAPQPRRPALAEFVPPLPGLEERLAQIWRQVLGVDRVGRHDDFADLGGHSLLAVRLVLKIRAALGTAVPLTRLSTTPTVAGLAAYLDGHDGRSRPAGGDRVVTLGGTPGLQPLVLVHPVGGTLFCYLDLTGRVGSAFEVLGVQGDLLESGGTADLGEMAERYARELAPLLGDRRPVVAGWSAGGVIAHELAVRLERHSVKVHRLVLIDAHPHREAADPAEVAALDALRADVARRSPDAVEAAMAEPGFRDLLATLGVDQATLAGLDGATISGLMAYWQHMLMGLAVHRPSHFGGSADLLLARADDEASRRATVAGWRTLTGALEVTHIDGDHFELLREPSVTAVADVLRGSAERTGD
ncbi:amino acid adenylation domain-containing protein, partial [Sphaerisporangium flaviroseum]|uniref:non-ribosomal peptide synthetase n=1 Tax=Sphaerisporangium flaviroseum TaxID=509199 RepID=UPI0031E776A9